MDEQTLQERLARAHQLIREIHHIAIATVNADCTPHCSPVFMVFDEQLWGYWASDQESLHSENITRDPRVFLTIFDSREGHGGVYLSGKVAAIEQRSTALKALAHLRTVKEDIGGAVGNLDDYMGSGPQRIYRFIPDQAWVNCSTKRGLVVLRDQRFRVDISELRPS